MAEFNLGNRGDKFLVESTIKSTTSPTATDPELFIFGRYQNPPLLCNPIRDFLFDPVQWPQFAEHHCRHAFTPAVWDAQPAEARQAQLNIAPFRVMQFRARRLPSGVFQIGFVTNANPAQHLRIDTMRMCDLDEESIARGLPHHLRALLILNALRNIEFAQDFTEKLVIIDLYPDRPVGTQGVFHQDCGQEHTGQAVIQGAENVKYVSLLFLPRTDRLVRGSLLTTARQLTDGRPRTAVSLITQTGGTLMFRDSLTYNSANQEIPYMAHATPPAQVVPVEGRVDAMVTGQPGNQFEAQAYHQQRSTLVDRMNAATLAGLEQVGERAFTRVHIVEYDAHFNDLTPEVHPLEIDIRLPNPFFPAFQGINIPPTPTPPVTLDLTANSVDELEQRLRELARYTTGGKETKKTNKTNKTKQPRKLGGGNKNVIVKCSRYNFVDLENVKLVIM